nr:transposase [Streptococcus mitis]
MNQRRWEIEESFRIMKQELRARPVYLSRSDRIQAHFTICFLALMIYRLLEKQIGETVTCSELIQTLRNYKFKHLYGVGYLPTYTRTTITDQLHQAFGFQTDFEIISEKNMKKFLKNQISIKSTHFFKREKELRKAVIAAFRGSLFSKNC